MSRILLPAIIVIAVAPLAYSQKSVPSAKHSLKSKPALSGLVIQPDEGEVLQLPMGPVVIKADHTNGSPRFAMGTQQLNVGMSIRPHTHQREDEIFFVYKGKATAVLGDKRVPVGAGTTIYVPPGVLHGIEDVTEEFVIFFVIQPPGMMDDFRKKFGSPKKNSNQRPNPGR